MQYRSLTAAYALAAIVAIAASPAISLEGDVGMHDPSTVIQSDGRYYSFGTGGGLSISVSDDGWVWRREGTLILNPFRSSIVRIGFFELKIPLV